MRYLTRARIIGTGMTKPATKSGFTATELMQKSLESALANAGIRMRQLDGLVAVPSLSEPHFMEAHYLATRMGLLPSKGVVVRTIDTGGAGPISGLIEADLMIRNQGLDLVAVVAGDAVSSLPTEEFLKRADAGCLNPDGSSKSPVIPMGYDRIAEWQTTTGSVTREQLAMVSVLMNRQCMHHPYALGSKTKISLNDVLTAKPVGNVTGLLECARRADGGAAIILASTRFMKENNIPINKGPVVLAGGEASGPLYPPKIIDEEMFSCEEAVTRAYEACQLGVSDIDFFGLYDCFPICFVRAIEAVGLAPRGQGGAWVEKMYKKSEDNQGILTPKEFPVNTHGGLLSFGAPWETPAMYNIIEAVQQLNGTAGVRQVPDCKRALVYGNGGIFSASSVAILGRGSYN